MSELEAEWARRVAAAAQRARAAGRGDVADYLAVRAANDLARTVGVEWLLNAFAAHAATANRAGAGITLAQDDGHRFAVGRATMVGRRLVMRAGVRTLTVEAGWPRLPQDGFVRGGGLACAQVTHFGASRAGAKLLLVPTEAGAPQWLVLDDVDARTPLTTASLHAHVARLWP